LGRNPKAIGNTIGTKAGLFLSLYLQIHEPESTKSRAGGTGIFETYGIMAY
jgi:hypothetical protein